MTTPSPQQLCSHQTLCPEISIPRIWEYGEGEGGGEMIWEGQQERIRTKWVRTMTGASSRLRDMTIDWRLPGVMTPMCNRTETKLAVISFCKARKLLTLGLIPLAWRERREIRTFQPYTTSFIALKWLTFPFAKECDVKFKVIMETDAIWR